jgi:hypothetical protein
MKCSATRERHSPGDSHRPATLPLGAVVAEGGEAHVLPQAVVPDQHREVAHEVVPPVAHGGELPELGVDPTADDRAGLTSGVALAEGGQPGSLDRLDDLEEGPPVHLLLEVLLSGPSQSETR